MAQRQHSDAPPSFVNRQERASLDDLTIGVDSLGDNCDDFIGEQVLSSDLHHARRSAGASCEDCEKSRSFVMTMKWCSFAHVRISTSGAVAAPIVDQWTASNP